MPTEPDPYNAAREDLGAVEQAVFDVLCPDSGPPIFEWGHETTPTPEDVVTLVKQITEASRAATNASTDKVKRLPIQEFADEGYLFEVNRRFLHPLGLALEWVDDPDDPTFTPTIGGVWDYRDDPEGMLYGDAMLAANADKAVHIARLEKQRINARMERTGFWVQPVEGVID